MRNTTWLWVFGALSGLLMTEIPDNIANGDLFAMIVSLSLYALLLAASVGCAAEINEKKEKQ